MPPNTKYIKILREKESVFSQKMLTIRRFCLTEL